MIIAQCDLCGLRVGRNPFARRFDESEKTFCCLGCLNVYVVLSESGTIASGQNLRETELFQRSLALGLVSNVETATSTFTLAPDAPTQEALFQVSGMWCSSCAWLIEHALQKERGVVRAEAFFASDMVKVLYCPQYLPPECLRERIAALGYQASDYSGENEHADAERRDLLLRLGVAGFLWMNIMTLSFTLYVSFFEPISASIGSYLPFVLWILATPVVFYCAWPILRLAWLGARERTVRMETLLSLGILAAYVYSIAQAFRGDPHVYFDTAAAIVTLVLAGKLIERSAKERTTQAVTLLYRLMPKKVRLCDDERERFVAIDALQNGDRFIVKAGERIPADGLVIEGQSHADESLLTGESAPVAKQPGSSVVAGSLNTGSVLQIAATRIGDDTTLAQIIQMVEHALGSRTTLERTVDRIARTFVPTVIVIALLTFLICWLGGFTSSGEALLRAITVLVIACPCALGLATPLALTAAIGAAARQGILVSDSRVLETIRKLDVVVFDKTGTVTDGDFALLDSHCFAEPATLAASHAPFSVNARLAELHQSSTFFTQACLPLLAAVERYSEHPLGRALVKAAEDKGAFFGTAHDITVHKGQGITGQVGAQRVFIGNRSLLASEGAALDEASDERALQWERAGCTVAFFGWDGALRGLLTFGDRLKPEAASVVEQLKARGIKVLLVSGDAPATVRNVADALHIADYHAAALPKDKVRVIAELQARGMVVAFIGDGINDAPALAQADLGLTLGSGADIAMRASAVVLMNNSLDKVNDVFALAQRTWRIVRQNLFWAFVYNVLSISLAVTGVLNPLLAAVAMLLSSFSVIANSQRLTKP